MIEFLNSLIFNWWGILILVIIVVVIFLIISTIFYVKIFKRFYDILFSFLGLVLLFPLLLLISIMVIINLGRPIIFKQKRPGRNEEIFTLYKYRTMKDENLEGQPLPDCKRLTKFGKFLRSTSLDELPELWNIFTGKMSIVGPRPLLVEYLPLYDDYQRKRHNVRPGLTGLAQVSGRNSISWEQKFKYDVYYTENITLFNDIKIIIKTILKTLKREGITSKDCETAKPFEGETYG